MASKSAERARAFSCWCAFGWVIWIGTTPARAEQPPHELTLKEALAIAATHSPTVQQARAQSAAAQGRKVQARSGLLPQLTATAVYARVHGAGTTQLGAAAGSTTAGLTNSVSGSYNRFSL